MMRARERNRGTAPETTRSFTVPLTASVPMSPPGKKIGIDDIAVRGEGDAAGQEARVAELAEEAVGEAGNDLAGDEIPHELAAAAELQTDPFHDRPLEYRWVMRQAPS